MNDFLAKDIDEYIASFPGDISEKLETIRSLVKKLAPDATESISYKMPAFKLDGKVLMYFAGFKKHIGIYPFPSGIKKFAEKTKNYKTSKGTIRLELDREIPIELLTEIIKFRMDEVRKESKTY